MKNPRLSAMMWGSIEENLREWRSLEPERHGGQSGCWSSISTQIAVRTVRRSRWPAAARLIGGDVAQPIRDLLQARHHQSLPFLDTLDEVGGVQQRFARAGVEPGDSAAEPLDVERALFAGTRG